MLIIVTITISVAETTTFPVVLIGKLAIIRGEIENFARKVTFVKMKIDSYGE